VDIELFRMEAWIGFDEDRLADHLFHLLEPLRTWCLELFDDFWVYAKHDISAVKVLLHLTHLYVDIIADRNRRLHHACPSTNITSGGQGSFEGLFNALSGDGNEAKIVKLKNLRGSSIVLQLFFQSGHDLIAVLALVHVDKVDDDDAAQIAQTNLPNNFRDGIEVSFHDSVFKAGCLANELASIDVDRDKRFSLVDNNGAPRFKPDLRPESLIDLFGDAKLLKEWRFFGVELHAADKRGLKALQESKYPLVIGFAVDPDGGEVVSDLVAKDALDKIEIVIDERWRL